jgi:hypothetical protein
MKAAVAAMTSSTGRHEDFQSCDGDGEEEILFPNGTRLPAPFLLLRGLIHPQQQTDSYTIWYLSPYLFQI